MPPKREPVPFAELPPGVQPYFTDGVAPGKVMLLARGMAPGLTPEDLGLGLYQASLHPNEKIAEAATKTAGELPDAVYDGLLVALAQPMVLDFFATVLQRRPAHLQRILLNQSTADETYLLLAGALRDDGLLEIIARNEARLIRMPPIIEALYLNPATRMSTANRLMELAVRHGLELDLPAYKEVAAALGAETRYTDPGDQALAEAAADEAFVAAFKEDEGEEAAEAGGGSQDADLKKKASLLGLSVSQKIRLAMIGSGYHRALLLRDPNRVVSLAAIKSPAIKETEIIGVTVSRSVNDDVIRFIANHREWMKLYQVKANLVANPKCPLPTSLRLLPHLRANDLRALAHSKNVPSALSGAARHLLEKKK
jgi:hypothetical protein